MSLRKSLLLSAAVLALAVSASACASVSTDPKAPSGDDTSFGTYLSAHVAAGQHDLSEAARLYQSTFADNPDDVEIANRAFLYTAASGDVDKAIELAKKVVDDNSSDRAARLALAVGEIKHENYARARSQLAASGKGPFTTLTLLLVDGWAAEGAGDIDTALKDMDALSGAGGTPQLVSYNKALILDLAGRNAEAEADYQSALQASANGPRANEAYGRFLERQGRTAEAKALYEKLRASDSLRPLADAGLARIAAGEKPDRLVNGAQEGAAEGLFSIAVALNDATSADIAILYLRLALYLQPDFDLAKIVLADRFETLKKYDDAITVYRTIDDTSPYQAAAIIQIAIDEGRLGNNDQAIADLKTVIAKSPNDVAAWTSLADAYRAASKDQEAIDAYTKAIALLNPPDKDDWQLFFARAVCEENLKQYAAAEADLNTALKMSPDQPQVMNYLGYTWVDQGRNLPQALALLEKARALSPYDGYIVDSVGWAYFRLAQYKLAAEALQAAVLLVPGDATINEHLGDAYWMSGRKLDARFQWNHALAFNTDPKAKVEIEKKLADGLDAAQARAGK
ncbi:MAG: tetratricopeptide repeat protein [Proteobacteria bacterium]|nr:tetratricopeptide repeat protein [Pseudomonadota bacterium]